LKGEILLFETAGQSQFALTGGLCVIEGFIAAKIERIRINNAQRPLLDKNTIQKRWTVASAEGETTTVHELVQITERSYYIQCPAKIGLVRLAGNDICLIDRGSDKDAGRKIRQVLDANGWRLTAIYNTHCNADHIGGNQYLQKQTGCQIYALESSAISSDTPSRSLTSCAMGTPSGSCAASSY